MNKKCWIIWYRYFIALLTLFILCAPFHRLLAEEEPPETSIHKTLAPLLDENQQPITDRYQLSLDILSKSGSQTQTQPLDVIFVADLSGSMIEQDVNVEGEHAISRIESLKRTLKGIAGKVGLVDSILANSQNRLSIVGFAGKIDNSWDNGSRYHYSYRKWPEFAGFYSNISKYDDAETLLNWENDANQAKNVVDSLTIANEEQTRGYHSGIGRGTNIEAGLRQANELLKSARPEAKKVIILLSDGEANMYYDQEGNTLFNYSSLSNVASYTPTPAFFTQNLDTAMAYASSYLAPQIDGFYSIKFRYIGAKDSITSLNNHVGLYNPTIPNEVLSATDETSLQSQFDAITKKILPLGVRKVTITDTLSKFVSLIPENSSDLRVVKVDENGGEERLTESQVIINSITDNQGHIKVIAEFNPDYSLEDNVTYALRFSVETTQEASDTIAGDTSVTEQDAEGGDRTKLYSNVSADVTYTYGIENPKESSKEFTEKPIFRPSDPINLPVTVEWKGVEGLNENNITAPKPDSINVKLIQNPGQNGYENRSYRITEIQTRIQGSNPNHQVNTSSFQSVARGHEYDVDAPDIKGFEKRIEKTSTGDGFKIIYRQLPSLTIEKRLEAEKPRENTVYKIKFTNSYAPVSKDSSDWLKENYDAIIKKAGAPDEEGKKTNIQFIRGKAEIQLRAGEVIKILYMKRATHYKIEEDSQSAKGYQVSYNNQESNVFRDMTAVVINHKLPQLSVKKELSGAFANLLQDFTIHVTVQVNGQPLNGSQKVMAGGTELNTEFVNGTASIQLKNNQTIKFENLPLGATYSVKENDESAKGYQVSYINQTGTLDGDKDVIVRNTKNSVPATGIDLLATPATLLFVSLLGGSGVIVVLIQSVKRRRR
ncbi:DUF7601 domain-containing protein [Streptococcus sp. DD10]|uniref:DUF7601 domain-containing protein n=1 Tax=Streptococcus sp. DD10 TaxID=1777878 RepID=UPI0008351306|nr:DUF5979 domain-containing protein [Streptococcus sp. DD10]